MGGVVDDAEPVHPGGGCDVGGAERGGRTLLVSHGGVGGTRGRRVEGAGRWREERGRRGSCCGRSAEASRVERAEKDFRGSHLDWTFGGGERGCMDNFGTRLLGG